MRIKPRITFGNGMWWCRGRSFQGCGGTPLVAYCDHQRTMGPYKYLDTSTLELMRLGILPRATS